MINDVMQAIETIIAKQERDSQNMQVNNLSGGCIHTVLKVQLQSGEALVAKVGHDVAYLFKQESAGLEALAATETVRVPDVVACDHADGFDVLLMEYLKPASADATTWPNFGKTLAKMHAVEVGEQYGFDHNNCLGPTSQPNEWHEDWVAFNQSQRIGHQIELAMQNDRLTQHDIDALQRLNGRLDEFLPRRPKPAMLHGDLWSGNAIVTDDQRVAVIDPAVYIGDGWADIAMMQLFGGFPTECIAAYTSHSDDLDNVEVRIAVYQLYHLLNHLNIFGSGYLGQVRSMVQRLANT